MRRRNNPNAQIQFRGTPNTRGWVDMVQKIVTGHGDKPVMGYDELSDSILEDCYEAEFGKPPHHRMKRETIVRKLNDACNVSA